MILALALAGIGLVGLVGGLLVEFTEIGARAAEFVGGRHPAGRRDLRKLKNLRPGQVIVPSAWKGESEDGHGVEWAIVTAHPIGMQLENRVTRRKRWEWRVLIRFPHEAQASSSLDGDGTEDIPIIVPTKAESARLEAELAELVAAHTAEKTVEINSEGKEATR